MSSMQNIPMTTNKLDLGKEVYKGMEHRFVINIKELEGTVLHPDYDWTNHKCEFCCDEDDEEEY